MQPKITAMLIMARECRLPLLEALEACAIDVLPVCDCSEARRILATQPEVQVVLTDAALPDGDWPRVLEIVAQERANVAVVVCSRLADHRLWIDALERGAYDLLVECAYRKFEILFKSDHCDQEGDTAQSNINIDCNVRDEPSL